MVSANLETIAGENGSVVVRFQISPDLADECSISLFVRDPDEAGEHFYAVQLDGYVTDKK